MSGERLVLHLFTPRWHGFARWRLERWTPETQHLVRTETLEEGWLRRPRGAEYERFEPVAR